MAITLKDVAQHAGVSTATVSRVLNDDRRIQAATKARVRASLDKLGYHMNHLARGLRTKKSFTIGFVSASIVSEFCMHVAHGVELELKRRGYSLIICDSEQQLEQEIAMIRMLTEKSVDGLIILPATNRGAHYAMLRERGIPFVLVDRLVDDYPADAVLSDNVEGCRSAVDHLIKSGQRRIGFIAGDLLMTSTRERLEGYRRAHLDNGLAVDENLIRSGVNSRDFGFSSMRDLREISPSITSVMLSNYRLLVGALGYLARRPEAGRGLALASFDDPADLTYLQRDFAVVVAQRMQNIGEEAARLLYDRLDGADLPYPRIIRLPTELRKSPIVEECRET